MVGVVLSDPTRGESEPGRCWTATNMQEATPDVMTPMCWSLWAPVTEVAARRAWHDIGLLPASMTAHPGDVNQCIMAPFFGRQALNVDRLATLMGALPGTSREQVELDLLGTVRAHAPNDPAPRNRLPFILARAPGVIARQTAAVSALHHDQHRWWCDEVLPGTRTAGRALLASSRDRFRTAMRLHARSRFLSQAAQGALVRLADGAGVGELAMGVYAGFGGVTEVSVAEDLWLLSRGELDEAGFLRSHGYHGRNEGNVSGTPWRSDASAIRAMAAGLRSRPDTERPSTRERAAIERGRMARLALRAALPRSRRPLLGPLVRLAGQQVRCMERTKASFLMAIDGARAAVELLGPELAARGHLADSADALFLTVDEHLAGTGPGSAELATFRRGRRDAYRSVTLPTTFVGMPEPVEVRAAGVGQYAGDTGDTEVSGIGGATGDVTGPARVAVELDDAADLEPGEILVCHYTDPAWSSAMALASGLVIDLGATSSHGAIVARELGIPCVIGTGRGTDRIRTGDLLHVDGTAGRVEILQRAERRPR